VIIGITLRAGKPHPYIIDGGDTIAITLNASTINAGGKPRPYMMDGDVFILAKTALEEA